MPDTTPPAVPDAVSASFLSSPLEVIDVDSRPVARSQDLYAADDMASLLRNLEEKDKKSQDTPPTPPAPERDGDEGDEGDERDEDGDKDESAPPKPSPLKDKFKDEDFTVIYEDTWEPEPDDSGDDDFLKTQPIEEQDLVATLRWAEKEGKAKGKSSQYVDFLRKHQEFLKSGVEVNSYEHEEWLEENRPSLNPAEVRQWERGYDRYQAKEEMREEMREQNKKLRDLEVRPELEAQRSRINEALIQQLPKSVLDGLEEYGMDAEGQKKLMEALPVETSVSNQVYVETRDQVMAYLDVTRGVKKFDPDNPAHTAAARKVVEFGRMMESRPDKEALVRDGKQFAPREKFVTMSPEERDKHWTFSPDHILGLFAEDMRLRVEKGIEEGRKSLLEQEDAVLKKYGLQRPATQNQPTNVSYTSSDRTAPPPPVRTRPSSVPSTVKTPTGDVGGSWFTSPTEVEPTLKLPTHRLP